MTAAELKALCLDNGHLRVTSTWQADALVMEFAGNAESLSVQAVQVLLSEAHREALARGAREVNVNIRQLNFMNSSCFKAFVTWLHDARALEATRTYRIRFLASPNIYWQSRSLEALRTFAPDLVSIEGS